MSDPLAAFAFLDTMPAAPRNGTAKAPGWQDPLLEDVPEGQRNAKLTELVGRWYGKNLSAAEVSLQALAVNAGWRAPLPEAEVRAVVASVGATHARNHPAPPAEKAETPAVDPLAGIGKLRDLQIEVMDPRTWYWEGIATPGFNVISARKAMGKTFLLFQGADAMGDGKDCLGRKTVKAKVLFVSFELDALDVHERTRGKPPLSENVYITYSWPSGDKGLELAERAITEYGFKVLIFDTFLPMVPQESAFEINSYGDSMFYLKWRLLGKKHGAAIIASWHEGKAPREDFMLNGIGSTGMIGQADCVVSIDRKRGDTAGKLWIGGNHAPETAIPFLFENGTFTLAEGQAAIDRLSPTEEKVMAVLKGYPNGAKTAAVALALGKTEGAARVALNRLEARGKVSTAARGVWNAVTLF